MLRAERKLFCLPSIHSIYFLNKTIKMMNNCECVLPELPSISTCMIEKFYPIDIQNQIDSGLVVKIGLKAGEYPKLCHELIKAKIEALIIAGKLTKETIPKTILFHFTNDY